VQDAPPASIVVQLVQTPAHEVTLGDVVWGSLGLAAVLLLLAMLLGALLSGLLFAWNRYRPPEADHLPSVNPFTPGGSLPPSSRAR
jgi:Zn-dependent protease with chaperone function